MDRIASIAARTETTLTTRLADLLPDLENLFYAIHEHPELSGAEEHTAARVAERFHEAGLAVTEKVGGHGVVGVCENGPGPVVALRADMDALPVAEDTGLPYASRVTVAREDGSMLPVMHACGHDAHTTCLVGTAQLLCAARDQWSGTVVFVAQPAEETMRGAAAMLADGLFTRFPRPDVVLGQHVTTTRAGMVHHRPGTFAAGVRNIRVRIFGTGGHGAAPHGAVDPIVIAAQLITMLQTVVSREINPVEPAVLTVGSVHAGTRPNIIPPEAVLEITTRAATDEVLDQIYAAAERITRQVCAAARGGEPTIEVFEGVPATINDPALTDHVRAAHTALFADDVIDLLVMGMGAEDFALYRMPGAGRYDGDPIPTCYWAIGATEANAWDNTPGEALLERAMRLPVGHSPQFAIDPRPTLSRGVEAFVGAALACLGEPRGLPGQA